EVVAEVEHEVVDVELLRDAARVVDVGHRAAAAVALASPQLERDTHDLVTLLEQDGGRDRRVDTTRHRDEDVHVASAGSAGSANIRKRSTDGGTASSARSTSASVEVMPRLRRSDPRTSRVSTPIAAS